MARMLRPLLPAVVALFASPWLVASQASRASPPPAARCDAPTDREAFRATQKLTGKPLYSQHNEDLILRDFFQGCRTGVFLDVGCASPIDDSNTYYLEKHLGWSGIAVDALPEFAAAWQRKRPSSKFFNYLVSDHSDNLEAFYRSELRGTSSAQKERMKGPGGKDVRFEELRVPTITLTKLLEQNGVSRLDFLSMDIEGFEPIALAGFDIERFRPALVCVEVKPHVRQQILDYFAAHGYQRIDRYLEYDQVNYYFAPKPSR
jgi:FkbM family methyltransferase